MNIVNRLTFRHIKGHMKRTVLTVFAIIISVAMVTAVFASSLTMMNFFRDMTISVDGYYHAVFSELSWTDAEKKLKANDKIETFVPTTTELMSEDNDILIRETRKEFLDLANIRVSEGRFPENENEILLSQNRLKKSFPEAKPGDTIEITVRPCEEVAEPEAREFTLVGISDSGTTLLEVASAVTYATDERLNESQFTQVMARYKSEKKGIHSQIEADAKDMGCSWTDNAELLAYSGALSSKDSPLVATIESFAAILLIVIAVVSVFMIYDSFAVSYQERAKYLGLLASVGATKRQKRQSLYFEAFLLGIVGIPLGILAGFGGISVTFRILEPTILSTLADAVDYSAHIKVIVNPAVVAGTVLVSAFTLFVSAYIPAVKASKTTPIEAIRQTNTVKVRRAKSLRVSKLTGKLFGFEGVMAVKNYKRNAKRSRTIVFSLFLSIVVFISAVNFSLMFSQIMTSSYTARPDAIVEINPAHSDELEKVMEDYIDRFYAVNVQRAFFDENSTVVEGQVVSDIRLIFLDDASLDTYARQIGADVAALHEKGRPAGILCNNSYAKTDSRFEMSHPLNNVEGKEIDFEVYAATDYEGEIETEAHSALVVKQTEEYWKESTFGYNYTYEPMLVMSLSFLADFVDLEEAGETSGLINYSVFTKDAEKLDERLTEFSQNEKINVYVQLTGDTAAAIKNILTVANTFAFGFIVLITMIAVINIINTIANAMNERRREFAMLRSVGMTQKGFMKTVCLESLRYGLLALIFGLPVSIGIHFLEYTALSSSFDFGFRIQLLPSLAACVAVFAVIGLALLYSIGKIKDDNIIETLRTE